jgi:hypothetical protein
MTGFSAKPLFALCQVLVAHNAHERENCQGLGILCVPETSGRFISPDWAALPSAEEMSQ